MIMIRGAPVVDDSAAGDAPARAPIPVVFGAPPGPLVGLYHAPEGPTIRPMGVVLCNPLGYEAMCAHRTYRCLAERLAARGFPVLRFDYHGTGDSSGYADGPGRVRAWRESIGAAIDELRERAGVHTVALIGVRFGATLAAIVAAERRDVEALVLWAPSPSGRAYVRELRAFGMIKQPAGAPRQHLHGGEEAAGYLFDRATVTDLSAIDISVGRERTVARALIVGRDVLPGAEPRLAKHFEECGVDVRLTTDSGYARMMRDPQETVVPFATLDRIVDWLEEWAYGEAPTPAPPMSTRNALVTASRVPGVNVKEQAFRFGEGQRLFGISTQPTNRPLDSQRPAVVFLNVGANHRVGPNRMYVSLARDLASLGYLGFRFDVGGLGDSTVPPGAPENRLYSKDSVGDVKAALTFLGERFGVDRFLLVGLCSGAYLAFHTCVEDPRVTGQILLNPQTFEWKDGDSLELSVRKSFLSTRYYARALLDADVWWRALRGQLNVYGVARVLQERLKTQVNAKLKRFIARVRGEREPQSEVERAFHAMCLRGVDTLLIFSFNDGGLDMIEQHLGINVEKMRDHANLRLEIVEGADHTFTPIDSQVTLHELVRRHVTTHFP